jgi:hypothetical protein
MILEFGTTEKDYLNQIFCEVFNDNMVELKWRKEHHFFWTFASYDIEKQTKGGELFVIILLISKFRRESTNKIVQTFFSKLIVHNVIQQYCQIEREAILRPIQK